MFKIDFYLPDDENGCTFSSSSEMECYYDLGDTVLDLIGQQFNHFLRQAGYYRKNDHLLMEDLTEEELYAVNDFLMEYREKQKEEQNGQSGSI